jgi:hypothetical protein
MYKSRLAQWQLAKHKRSSDMAFVHRKKKQRDAQGKTSNFVIRGKAVTSEQVNRYFREQRKTNRASEKVPMDVPTPAHIECFSDLDDDTHPDAADNCMADSTSSDIDSSSLRAISKLNRRETTHHLGTGNNNNIQCRPAYRTIKMKTQNPTLLRALTSPDIFLQPERLFTIIPIYINSFITSATTWTSRDGKLSIHNNNTINPLPFRHFSHQAIGELKSGSILQGRIFLSKACALLPQMLQNGNPHTLYVILDTFLWLREEGLVGIYALIQNYIAQLVRIVLPSQALVQEIWLKLSAHDPEQLDLVKQTQRCIWDAMSRVYKWFSRASAERKSTFIACVNEYQDFISLDLRAFGELRQFRLVNEGLDNTALFITHKLASSLASQGQYKLAVVLLAETLIQESLASSVSREVESNLMQIVELALADLGGQSAMHAIKMTVNIYHKQPEPEFSAMV